ncbi:response regulator [Antarcticibacterium sp. 1MA-6-2]|uniref:response regulator n=1 Tax=Antarcticibacterium sp. 1MA-6-2 TaxID=2908210 RepID=UPI001F37097E|nr:response regulator [Antarcticibacterium sp. 1MA-6-2]UJH92068.1 response regulator [Antarcticibacterium sp. 1MA-6-2]
MKKALVIQEDIIILKILERLMKVNSYDCKAIRSLYDLNIEDQNYNYDIIISDILFDGIAPLDFIYQIKEIILHRSLLIVTDMGQDKIEQDLFASKNIDGFFAAPFDMQGITKLIA